MSLCIRSVGLFQIKQPGARSSLEPQCIYRLLGQFIMVKNDGKYFTAISICELVPPSNPLMHCGSRLEPVLLLDGKKANCHRGHFKHCFDK